MAARLEQARAAGRNLTIGEYYEANPARRGQDRRFGQGWRTVAEPSCDYDVFWVPNTGELAAMRAPRLRPGYVEVGDGYMISNSMLSESGLTVEVLGVLNESQVESLMDGWEAAMAQPGSLDSLRGRVNAAAPSD